MRLLVSFCLLATSSMLAGSISIKSLVFPTETSTTYVEMVPQKPLELKAFTLCMRVATELGGEREIILFAYRTRDFDELNVWRENDGRFSFYLAGGGALFRVPEFGAMQTHLCFTWDSHSGAANIFMDGQKGMTQIYRKGHTVRPAGKVILGQDPDSYFGDFDAAQSFVGEVSDVNMWDSVLSESAIYDVFTGRRVSKGNIFDWESTEIKLHGDVEVVNREM